MSRKRVAQRADTDSLTVSVSARTLSRSRSPRMLTKEEDALGESPRSDEAALFIDGADFGTRL